jgi:LPXTG-motif cell wall-anchored protein
MKNQKNNKFIERSNYEKVTHYSIRKVSFGAASVAIAVAFMFLGGRSVSAAEPNNAPTTNQSATANTKDEAANQVFDAPSKDANVTELNTKLQALPDKIKNNTKINDMDQLGATTGVEAGKVKDITEFGGWTAINGGKFIIAKKSDKGVFPIETVNSVRQGDTKLVTWLNESTFDRKGQYMLFLGNVRTEINKDKPVTAGTQYNSHEDQTNFGKGLVGYNGIEKTFEAYSPETGSKVNIAFKTGFTGDMNGRKAKYKVEVIAKTADGKTEKIYEQTFDPSKSIDNKDMKVTPATIGGSAFFTMAKSSSKDQFNEKISELSDKLGKNSGTFTSKNIILKPGVVSYITRISAADNNQLGMGFNTNWEHVALPISGTDFNIDQDTNILAKDLLKKIYNKLIATKDKDERGMTEESKKAYDDQLEAVKKILDATTLSETKDYKTETKTTLEKHKGLTVDKSGLEQNKKALDDFIASISTDGKTKDSKDAYDVKKTEADTAVADAKKVLDNQAATVDEVADALANVKIKKAELAEAKAKLVDVMTGDQKADLEKAEETLKLPDTKEKTPASVAAYQAAMDKIQADLTAAKTTADEVINKKENATKAEATDAQVKIALVKVKLVEAAALLKDKADKAALKAAKEDLVKLTSEADPTTGKTQTSKDAYDKAKRSATQAEADAQTIIDDENATPEAVADELAKVNKKKADLEEAKTKLVDAITADQKAALAKVADDLKLADTKGKTSNSVNAYNTEIAKIQDELAQAKQTAKEIIDKKDEASKAEAHELLAKVATLNSKLVTAAGALKDQAVKTELVAAKKKLESLIKEDPTKDKTTTTKTAYDNVKKTAEQLLTKAQNLIADDNATQDDVDAILENLLFKPDDLADAKTKLVDAITADQKAALAKVADDLKLAETTGKTPDSVKAYNDAVEKIKAELEAVKQAAKTVQDKGDDATKAEATAVQDKVAEVKAKLTKAAELLKDKADKETLKAAKAELAKLTSEADPTNGKTKASKATYDQAKADATQAEADAQKVIDDDNATAETVAAALAKVNENKVALADAKTKLVDAITADQEAALAKVADDLKLAETTGKTPDSIKAYNDAVEKIKAELEAVKQAAKTVQDKGDDATKAEATAVQDKVAEVKAKLTKAAELLKDKADKETLKTAKAELAKLTSETDPTNGKTQTSKAAYDQAKADATQAEADAQKVIDDDNATAEAVAAALAKVNEKKSALADAKAKLVDAITAEQKAALAKVADDLKLAETTGKTPDSVKAYNDAVEKIKTELEAVKQAAKTVQDKGDDATKAEATEVQEKIAAVKAKLTKATELLKDQVSESHTDPVEIDTPTDLDNPTNLDNQNNVSDNQDSNADKIVQIVTKPTETKVNTTENNHGNGTITTVESKANKQNQAKLPNTGAKYSTATIMVAIAGILLGFGLAAGRRKEKE